MDGRRGREAARWGGGAAAFRAAVHDVVRRIPRGRVASYGAVAALAGRPGAARAVGGIMAALPDGHDLPWWRVVNASGRVSPRGAIHGAIVQRRLLEAEGVRFDRTARIDRVRFGWPEAGPDPD